MESKRIMRKEVMGGLLFILISVLSLNMIFAADNFCFIKLADGQSVQITTKDKYTCTHTICQVCVDASTKWYAAWTKCSSLCDQQPVEEQPLSLSAIFPFPDNGVFTKQSFFMDIHTNKIASIFLIDNVAGTQRTLCPNCNDYQKSTSFKQGFNDITIQAVKGNEVQEKRIRFTIDNMKPRIYKTLPLSNKYGTGEFSVSYDEDNIKIFTLNYGTPSNMLTKSLSCPSGKKQTCIVNADLKPFDGQQINYYFTIADIADNTVSSKPVKIYVDMTKPVIDSFSFNISKTYVAFNITISDVNLDKVIYYDNGDTRQKILCSSMRTGKCYKRVSFKKGDHDVLLQVTDKAGNFVEKQISFSIV